MALGHYQNTGLATANSLIFGGFRMDVAGTAGALVAAASCTNVGLGRNLSITENIGKYTCQADNGPDPAKGVATHTMTISFELLEWYGPTMDKIRGTGFDSESNPSVGTYMTGSAQVLTTGGFTELNSTAFKFTNRKLVSAATVETVIVVYKAYLDAGMVLTAKSDNDEDPINVYPVTLEAVLDTSRSAGDQLYIIETEIGG